jgi:hypothetical protein
MLESFDEGRTFLARDMLSVTGMILDIHFIDVNVGFIAGASEAQEEKAHARILKTTRRRKLGGLCSIATALATTTGTVLPERHRSSAAPSAIGPIIRRRRGVEKSILRRRRRGPSSWPD